MKDIIRKNKIWELAYDGKFDILKKELTSFPDLASKRSQDERQPLHWACAGGHDVIVDFLLDHCNVPVDEADDSGWTPLLIASSAGRELIVGKLLGRYADPNKKTTNGQTALHYAASRNRTKIVEMLLQNGADVNVQDTTTLSTPLHRAASKGNTEIVNKLLQNKCNIDIQDIEGNTALHMACEEERVEVAEMLVLHDASVDLQNKEKKTPLDLAPPYLKRRLGSD